MVTHTLPLDEYDRAFRLLGERNKHDIIRMAFAFHQ
jgi:hypothetical protein